MPCGRSQLASVAAALCAALALAPLSACKGRKAPIAGIGPWMLDKTTLARSGGICSPQDALTWCYDNPAISVGKQSASVDLYFRGHKNSAPLDEILLAVRACRVKAAAAVLTKELGAPEETLGTRKVWRNPAAVIVAQLPTDDGVCEINFVSPKDKKRIAELTKKKSAATGGNGKAKAKAKAAKPSATAGGANKNKASAK